MREMLKILSPMSSQRCKICTLFSPRPRGAAYRASISDMIRKLKSGQFRLYSHKKDAATGKRRNLGTFSSLEQAKQHEREVQYFKRH